jgi:hypothetical protein
MKNKKWGFINYQNQVIIPFLYNAATPFKNGKSKVIQNKEGYIIGKTGNIESEFHINPEEKERERK